MSDIIPIICPNCGSYDVEISYYRVAGKLEVTCTSCRTIFEVGDNSEKPTNPKDAIGSDKLPLHLWPTTASALGSLAMLDGACKYGRSNFRAIGVRASIYYDAALRHLTKWFEGEDIDPDSGVDHLGHVLACMAILVDAKEAGKLTDDRAVEGGYLEMMDRVASEVSRIKEKYKDKDPHHYTIQDSVEDE